MQSYFEAYTKSQTITNEAQLNNAFYAAEHLIETTFGYAHTTKADLKLDDYNYFIYEFLIACMKGGIYIYAFGWVVWYFFKNSLGLLRYVFTDGPWTMIEFAVTYMFWIVDDWSTAIGFQANDGTSCMEGNPVFSSLFTNMIEKYKLVTTETSAFRLVHILWVIGTVSLNLIPGLMNPYSKFLFIAQMMFKSWAGFRWFCLVPNDYGIIDFITFKPGKRRFDRMTTNARKAYLRTNFDIAEAPAGSTYGVEDFLDAFHRRADEFAASRSRRLVESSAPQVPVAPTITSFVDIYNYFFGA